jgi:23S rRNA pseudouridine1911/1915/1917 synthase
MAYRPIRHFPDTLDRAPAAPPRDRSFRQPAPTILWRQGDILAVDKPPGLAVIPGRDESTCLLQRLGQLLNLPTTGQSDPRVRVVHRIDKDTSGLVLFATTIAAQRHLSHQFQNNLIEKEYLALVAGRPTETTGSIDAPLRPDPANPRKMSVAKHGKRAQTDWQVEQPLGDWTLLRVRPRTGKTHQIRVHLKHIGLPLAIDPLYNPLPPALPGLMLSKIKPHYRPSRHAERPLIARLTLHAHRLTFENLDGSRITLEAPLPKDFRATITQLAKTARL